MRKDAVIKQLVDQAKIESQQQTQDMLSSSQQSNKAASYKAKLKQVKHELVMKNEELNNLARSLKYTRVQEY